MAVGFDGIEANPEKIIEKGGSVKQLASGCLTEIDNVDTEATKIGEAWDDDASKSFVAQMNEYKNDFLELQKQIENIGQILDKHGNRLLEDRDNLSKRANEL